ncbi:helix-turn-helix transcriptional regulator, partial [Streptomyces sp.]|uniref:helix-turn-helix transcriptional regulator n=1 Tax=Streptomyces sp. TaxID=1931 RepID=UPI002F42B2BE
RARGLLAEPDEAEAHYAAALDDPAGSLWPFERALLRLDYGAWLRARDRAAEAVPHLADALDVLVRLGARPWADRARTHLRAAEAQPSATAPRATGPAGLTPRELTIARLAAAGQTNRQIGERLSISPRTVGFHLHRIFPKLGVTARAQLRDALHPPGSPAPD